MSFKSWFSSVTQPRRRPIRSARKTPHRARLSLERLEVREVPAAITALASFDAVHPTSPTGLVADTQGNLYGHTPRTVFMVAAGSGEITTLATLPVSNDPSLNGPAINTELVIDGTGNLYVGAVSQFTSGPLDGQVFEVAAGSGEFTALASFVGSPIALVGDGNGNLFGAAYYSDRPGSDGIVFEVVAGSGAATVLASFDGSNGSIPGCSLMMDTSGNLFGTATHGGAFGTGTVFEVAAGSGVITTIASFDRHASSISGLVMDRSGNLFGTYQAYLGFLSIEDRVFEVAAGSNTITNLATFDALAIGGIDHSELAIDNSGNLFGTTGTNQMGYPVEPTLGSVFKVAAGSGEFTVLATFDRTNGAYPSGRMVLDSSGNLFGITTRGGATDSGTVFEVAGVGSTTPALSPTVTTVTGGTFTYDGTAHAGSGSVNVSGGSVTLSYVGINGTTYASATAPTNAGTYTVTATYAGDASHLGSSASAPLTITPKLLEASAASQGTINLGSNGSIVLNIAVAAGQFYGTDTVASLFNGATFTIAIQKADGSVTYGTLTSTAEVQSDGSITVAMQMDDTLRAELYDAYVNGRAVNFDMTATANGGNYVIDEDTMSQLLNNGAHRYVL